VASYFTVAGGPYLYTRGRLWALRGVASRVDVLVGASDCPGGQREFVRGLFGGVLAMGNDRVREL